MFCCYSKREIMNTNPLFSRFLISRENIKLNSRLLIFFINCKRQKVHVARKWYLAYHEMKKKNRFLKVIAKQTTTTTGERAKVFFENSVQCLHSLGFLVLTVYRTQNKSEKLEYLRRWTAWTLNKRNPNWPIRID